MIRIYLSFVLSHNVHYILSVYSEFHNVDTLCDHLIPNSVEKYDCLVPTVLKTSKIDS